MNLTGKSVLSWSSHSCWNLAHNFNMGLATLQSESTKMFRLNWYLSRQGWNRMGGHHDRARVQDIVGGILPKEYFPAPRHHKPRLPAHRADESQACRHARSRSRWNGASSRALLQIPTRCPRRRPREPVPQRRRRSLWRNSRILQ